MSGSRSRWWRRFLTPLFLGAIGGAVMWLGNLAWTWHVHYDGQRHELSRALWEKRQEAYGDLIEIAARTAAVPRSTADYVELHEQFYKVYGPLEIYRTSEMGDCVTTFRDTLLACATPDRPQDHRRVCDVQQFHFLLFRLSKDARESLVRSWNQPPGEFVDDLFSGELCGLGSAAQAQ